MNELGLSEWEPVKFGECVHDWAVGPRFSGDLYDSNGNVATLRTTDMDTDGCIELATMPLARIPLTAFMNHFLQSGDVVISRSGTCGITGVFTGFARPVLPGAFLIRFRLNEKALPAFIRYLFNSPIGREKLTQIAEGGVQKNIRGTSILRLPLELPPVAEQRKIAAILTTVDNLIEQTELLIEKYRRVKAGMMADLLTRGIDHNGQLRPAQPEAQHLYKQSKQGWIPKEWEPLKLGDLISGISSGWSPICDSEPVSAGEWGILKTTAVVWDGYVDTENKRLPSEYQPKPDIEVKADDILITRKGPVERAGVVVFVPQTQPYLMIPDTVFRIRLTHNCPLHPSFAPLSLGSETVQRDWFGRKVGLADAQVNINHSILRNTNLPVPPSDEQREILRRKIAMATNVHREQSQLEKLHRIKSGLMQNLLTGKVRVKVDASSGGTATT